MSLIWMILAGAIAGAVAKILMPRFGAGGLFVLGFGGSLIAGTIQYSQGHAIGFLVPLVGAAVLLCLNVFTARPVAHQRADRDDDLRKAA